MPLKRLYSENMRPFKKNPPSSRSIESLSYNRNFYIPPSKDTLQNQRFEVYLLFWGVTLRWPVGTIPFETLQQGFF